MGWRRRWPDVLTGAVVVAAATAYFVGATTISTTLSEDVLGPRAFPQLVAVLAAVLGAVLVVNAIQHDRSSCDDEHDPGAATPWRAYVAMALYGAYVWALVPLGYLISTVVFALAMLLVLGMRGRARAPLIAVALTAGLFLAFRLLNVPLPPGPLPLGRI